MNKIYTKLRHIAYL